MKKVKYIAATIILGALGSAFWELCLKKTFYLTINTLMPYLLQCFNDSFYSRVSRSLYATSFHSFSYIMLSFMILILMPPDFITRIFHSRQKEKRERIFQSVFRFSCFLIIAYNFFIVAIASNIAQDTLNNIDIVAPYVSDIEYRQLRSDFFQMDSKTDYENIVEELTSIAEENELQLK